MSAAYYAMFHSLTVCCANQIAGATPRRRNEEAWVQEYRALQNGDERSRCERSDLRTRFPEMIWEFAQQFVRMQTHRQVADYDPKAEFHRGDVLDHISETERIIARFNAADGGALRAFSVYVLLRAR